MLHLYITKTKLINKTKVGQQQKCFERSRKTTRCFDLKQVKTIKMKEQFTKICKEGIKKILKGRQEKKIFIITHRPYNAINKNNCTLTLSLPERAEGPSGFRWATMMGTSPKGLPRPPAMLIPNEPDKSCSSSTIRIWFASSL